MPAPFPSDDLTDLAEHGRFVRNLAWRLLHDEDAAEEVVQETMLAAVTARPARDRPLRPWLATVARNVIRRRFRTKDRVRRREEAAAKPEAVPSAFDLAARAEMLRDVVDAVLSLDEPNRSTILLRYYEDLPPREIAAQQGVGVEAVRGRLKRAIRQLRQRLDQRHGGPQGWAPLLGALCGHEVPAHLLAGSAGAGSAAAASKTAATASSATVGGLQGAAAAFLVGAGVAAATVGVTLGGQGGAGHAPREAPVSRPAVERATTAAGDAAAGGNAVRGGTVILLQERRRELQTTVAELAGRLAEALPKPGDASAFRVGLPPATPHFDAVAWDEVATHVRAMSELLVVIEAVVTGGEPLPVRLQEQMLEHNNPVAVFALDIGPEIGAPEANLAYTHPTVVANLVRATLQMLDLPLSRDQEVAVRALGEGQVLEEQAALAALDDGAPALARLGARIDARQRFVEAMKDLLTTAQQEALYHPTTESRLDLDMLSPGLLLPRTQRHHIDAADRAGLERGLLQGLFNTAGIQVQDLTPYMWIAREWAHALSSDLAPCRACHPDALFPRIEVVQRWIREQTEAIRRILATGALSADQAKSLLDAGLVLRPRLRSPEAESPRDG